MVFGTNRKYFSARFIGGCALIFCAQPVHAGDQRKVQGAALFAAKGCAHCHGPSGFGGSDSGPDLSRVRKELKPDEIAQQIHDGGKNMPPFRDSLSEDEIKSLVEYLHSRRKPPPGYVRKAPIAPVPTPATKQDSDPG